MSASMIAPTEGEAATEAIARQMYGAYCRYVSAVQDPSTWDELLVGARHGWPQHQWTLTHWRREAAAAQRLFTGDYS